MTPLETMSELRLRVQATVYAQRDRLAQLKAAIAETEREIAEGEQMLLDLGLPLQPPAPPIWARVPGEIPRERAKRPKPPKAAQPPAQEGGRHPVADAVWALIALRPLTKGEIVETLKLHDYKALRCLDGWRERGIVTVDGRGRYTLSETIVPVERRPA